MWETWGDTRPVLYGRKTTDALMASWSFSPWLNHLKMTWLCGVCRHLPFAIQGEGLGVGRPRRGAGVRPASGSGAGFLRKTASGSGSGPGLKRCGRSAPRSRHRDADLHKQAGFSGSGEKIGGVASLDVTRQEADTFVKRQPVWKNFVDANPAVFLAVYVSCYGKAWRKRDRHLKKRKILRRQT